MYDHLWQSTAFAIAAAVAAWALRRHRAGVRYWLWFSASIKFLVPFAILTNLGRQVESAPPMPANLAAAITYASEPFSSEISLTGVSAAPEMDWTAWIAAVWACGALVIAATRLRGWLRIRALIRTSREQDLPLPIEARTVRGLIEPGIAGLWKPMLLLPDGIRDHLTQQQFDAIVAHELAHVRRRDNLLALVHMVVETLFWFHPLVWWIGSRLMEERERACDEAVLAEGKDPGDYAEAIVSVCRRYLESPLACVSGVTGADLKVRIEAIFHHRPMSLTDTRKLLIAAAALAPVAIAFLAGIAAAQSQSFEVASIRLQDRSRQLKGGPAGAPSLSNGRLVYSSFVYGLIIRAFQLPGCGAGMIPNDCPRLVGAPDWTKNESYLIQATVPADTPNYTLLQFLDNDADSIYPMFQSLLRDRFALKYHRENRDLPAFALTVDRNGHKVKPTQAKMVTLSDGVERLQRAFHFTPFTAANGQPMLHLNVVNMSMADVAESLSSILDRPVVDRTGLSGAFDFEMDYEMDPAEGRPVAQLGGPELFTAFAEQAGLRLESTRAPIEVVVIDSIERPSEN